MSERRYSMFYYSNRLDLLFNYLVNIEWKSNKLNYLSLLETAKHPDSHIKLSYYLYKVILYYTRIKIVAAHCYYKRIQVLSTKMFERAACINIFF